MMYPMFQDMKLNKPVVDRTRNLLNKLSLRLSGRDDCKGINYTLSIIDEGDYQHIVFEPDVVVYPDRYHRKDTDKSQVLVQILTNHFNEHVSKTDEGDIFVHSNTFVCGNYRYVTSFNNKRRKWIRVN